MFTSSGSFFASFSGVVGIASNESPSNSLVVVSAGGDVAFSSSVSCSGVLGRNKLDLRRLRRFSSSRNLYRYFNQVKSLTTRRLWCGGRGGHLINAFNFWLLSWWRGLVSRGRRLEIGEREVDWLSRAFSNIPQRRCFDN